MLILGVFQVTNWLNDHLLTCFFKKTFGFDCPGCGFQRSVMSLIQGDVFSSLKLYPATLPILTLLVFLPVHLKQDYKHGAAIIKYLYIIIALIILINYVYKIFTNHLH